MKEKEHLHNFIVNNNNLEALESIINNFNPFNVLQIEGYEIRHSNVLGWLLDPNENHNIGDFFLKKVVSQIILENEFIIDDEIDLLDIHLGDFGDSIVERETNNIDILLVSKRNNFVLLVENKIHAKESIHQLTKYLNAVKQKYKGYKVLPVFLTKTGDEPKNNEHYAIFSHETIHRLIKESLKLKRDHLANSVVEFIEFYLITLEKLLGMNEDIKELCKKIYQEHKDALDVIYDTIKSDATSLKPAFESFIESHSELHGLRAKDKWLWFLPYSFEEILPRRDANWEVPFPLAFWIKKSREQLQFVIEIGPFLNGERRVDFVNYLESKGFSFTKAAKRVNSKYSRFYSMKSAIIKDWEDHEKILEALEKLYSNGSEVKNKLLSSLEGYNFDKA